MKSENAQNIIYTVIDKLSLGTNFFGFYRKRLFNTNCWIQSGWTDNDQADGWMDDFQLFSLHQELTHLLSAVITLVCATRYRNTTFRGEHSLDQVTE